MLYISPSLVAASQQGGTGKLDHTHIGYRSLLPTSTITATSSAAGFPASAVANSMTYERWSPVAVPATISIDTGASSLIDYVGIGAHSIGSSNASVKIEYSDDGSSWTTALDVTPQSDNAIMLLMEQFMARYWRITVDRVVEIGVIYIGRALEIPVCGYGGHAPGVLSRDTTIEPQKSVTGQFIGRSVVRQGLVTSYRWRHLDPDWYRDNFDPFVKAAITRPFFIAWYPSRYPDEVIYAWTSKDIRPKNMTMRDFMQVGFSVEAIA